MGGQGPGHRSVRAVEARLKNIQKARAARKRAPLPWRSGMESRIIEQLVWQWWITSSGEWLVTSGEKRQQQVPASAGKPHTATMRPVRDDSVKRKGNGEWSVKSVWNGAARPWAKLRVARLLGVSHTWVNKLVKRFEKDPDRMRRKMAAFAPANLEKLERAREETRRQRELGWLRGPIRWRRMKVMLQGKKRRVGVPTREEMRRRDGLRRASFDVARHGGQAQGQPYGSSAAPVRHSELPAWATGLMLPGDPGVAGHGPTTQTPFGNARGTPRPVPFAFRRRR